MIISYMACLCRTGVKFELIRLNKIRDYSLKSNHQEMQLFKVATSFGLCLKVLHFQEQPFKQLQYFEKKLPISFSHTLDDLHTLDKFSFTFRSSRSQIIFKIVVLKHLYWSLLSVRLEAFSPATLLERLQHRYFPVNIAKFIGSASFIEHLRFCTLNNYSVKF